MAEEQQIPAKQQIFDEQQVPNEQQVHHDEQVASKQTAGSKVLYAEPGEQSSKAKRHKKIEKKCKKTDVEIAEVHSENEEGQNMENIIGVYQNVINNDEGNDQNVNKNAEQTNINDMEIERPKSDVEYLDKHLETILEENVDKRDKIQTIYKDFKSDNTLTIDIESHKTCAQQQEDSLYMISFINKLSNNQKVQGHIKDYQVIKASKDTVINLMNHKFS
ncbi:hypothetical protein COP2_038943 [Malus domestica]